MNCSKCGTLNVIGSKICINCGNNLDVISSPIDQSDAIEEVLTIEPIGVMDTVQTESPTPIEINQQYIAPQTVEQPVIQPQNNYRYAQDSIQNYNTNIKTPKKGNNIKKLIIIAIIFVLLGSVFAGYKIFFKEEKVQEKNDISYTSAFFIDNVEGKFALFNKDGKQLTDFTYTRVGKFINGTAVVNINNKQGIINANGDIIVPMDKYIYISSVGGGLYKATNASEKHLLNNKGEVLYDLDNITVYDSMNFKSYVVLKDKKEKLFKVINYKEKELLKIRESDSLELDAPSVYEEDGFISVFYDNKNWVLNVNNGKEAAAFDSELPYCINSVSEDENIIVLNSCGKVNQTEKETRYKIIKNDKLYDKSSECDRISQNSEYLICYKGLEGYKMDSNLNVKFKIYGSSFSNDDGSYVMKNKTNSSTVDFYQNDKIIKSVSCRVLVSSDYSKSDIYILKTVSNKECGSSPFQYEYYNSKGEKIINKTFASAAGFGLDNLAKVSDNKKDYYLIDKIGKQIGKKYQAISFSDSHHGFYEVTNNDLKGIIDNKGNEVVPVSYAEVYIFKSNERLFARLKTPQNKYIFYDLDKSKELFSLTTLPEIHYDLYITTYFEGKEKFYTFDGKLFYEK